MIWNKKFQVRKNSCAYLNNQNLPSKYPKTTRKHSLKLSVTAAVFNKFHQAWQTYKSIMWEQIFSIHNYFILSKKLLFTQSFNWNQNNFYREENPWKDVSFQFYSNAFQGKIHQSIYKKQHK